MTRSVASIPLPVFSRNEPASLLSPGKRVNVPKLAAQETRPARKPKLGQHFLISESAVSGVLDALGDLQQRTVLEIGPGRGVLTTQLVRRARRVIAIEFDRVLAA